MMTSVNSPCSLPLCFSHPTGWTSLSSLSSGRVECCTGLRSGLMLRLSDQSKGLLPLQGYICLCVG